MIFTGVPMTKKVLPLPPPGPVREMPKPTPMQVPQYGPEWVAFALAGGTIVNGNTLVAPPEESIND